MLSNGLWAHRVVLVVALEMTIQVDGVRPGAGRVWWSANQLGQRGIAEK